MTGDEATAGRAIRLTLAAVLCALSVTAASACSTAEIADQLGKAQYVAEMRALVTQVKADANSLRSDLVEQGKPLDKVIGEAADDLVEVKTRLSEIKPPKQIAALHDQLASVVGQLSGVFSDAQQALLNGDLNGLLALVPQAQDLTGQVGQISQEFAAEGYRIEQGGK